MDDRPSERFRGDVFVLCLERIDRLLNFATVKGSLMLPANAVLIGFMLESRGNYLELLKGHSCAWVTPLAFLLSFSLSLSSIILAVLVIKAFLNGGTKFGEYYSLLYFGSIAKMSIDVFLEKIEKATNQDLKEDLARQIHTLSCALLRKFSLVNWSLGLFCAASVVLAVPMLLSLVK